MARAPKTTAAFDELLATLHEARDAYVLSEERHLDELEVVEGFRYVLHLVSEVTELLVEGDPERPRFSSIVTPARKFLGDNPDSLYQQAVIRGDRAYRITGRKEQQCYISFTIHGPDPAGGLNGPVQADVNDDGAAARTPTARSRSSSAPRSTPGAQVDDAARRPLRHRPQLLPAGALGPPRPRRAREARHRAARRPGPRRRPSTTRRSPPASATPTPSCTPRPWALRVFGDAGDRCRSCRTRPNTVGTPWSFRNAGVDAAGAVDIFYSSGTFDLAPDEALVMEGTLPPSRFTNVMLWNVHMQTLEYRSRRSSLNCGPDGARRRTAATASSSAHHDPGVPNWLDTGGPPARDDLLALPAARRPARSTPRCRVVPVGDVAGL